LAINPANEPYWEPPIDRYIGECLRGRSGPRQADFVARWVGAMVVEVHRILIRGGIYLYPKDSKQPPRAGRLRLLYEVSPMSFLVEQAGGLASTGNHPILGLVPTSIHQRVPVILGSREEVERVVLYHREPLRDADEPYRHPLFGHRSLFSKP
jgi:fructose-1,6-bisphosphatase